MPFNIFTNRLSRERPQSVSLSTFSSGANQLFITTTKHDLLLSSMIKLKVFSVSEEEILFRGRGSWGGSFWRSIFFPRITLAKSTSSHRGPIIGVLQRTGVLQRSSLRILFWILEPTDPDDYPEYSSITRRFTIGEVYYGGRKDRLALSTLTGSPSDYLLVATRNDSGQLQVLRFFMQPEEVFIREETANIVIDYQIDEITVDSLGGRWVSAVNNVTDNMIRLMLWSPTIDEFLMSEFETGLSGTLIMINAYSSNEFHLAFRNSDGFLHITQWEISATRPPSIRRERIIEEQVSSIAISGWFLTFRDGADNLRIIYLNPSGGGLGFLELSGPLNPIGVSHDLANGIIPIRKVSAIQNNDDRLELMFWEYT